MQLMASLGVAGVADAAWTPENGIVMLLRGGTTVQAYALQFLENEYGENDNDDDDDDDDILD